MSLKNLLKKKADVEKQLLEEKAKLQKAYTDAKGEYDAKIKIKQSFTDKCQQRAIDKAGSTRFSWFLISYFKGWFRVWSNEDVKPPDFDTLLSEYNITELKPFLTELLPKGLTCDVSDAELNELKKAMQKAKEEMEN